MLIYSAADVAADLAVAQAQTEIANVQTAYSIEGALRDAFDAAGVEGVEEILLLPRVHRLGAERRHKVYVVLETRDIDRDRRIVELMCQFDGIDYDLVPDSARSMLPDAAQVVWKR